MTKNVLGYIRVSTDEQADKGYSLDYQREYIERYCEARKYNLIHIYDDDYTGKTFRRPNYKEMENFALKKSNRVDLIVVVRWDRFARDLGPALTKIDKFKNAGIEVNSVEQYIDYKQPDYIVMLSMYLATSHAERLKISKRVKESTFKARSIGHYTSHPPKGYYWKKHTREEPAELLVNKEVAPLIHEAFKLYGTGLYSAEAVRKMMNEKGLNVKSKQNFLNLLRNRLYIGEVHVPTYNGSEDRWVRGVHEPIIRDKELFYKVQELLDGKKRNHPKAKLKIVPDLYLRNFLICPVCGGNMTGSYSRSRTGERYPYYHCNHNGHARYSAIKANQRFIQLLDSFVPDKAVLDLFKAIMADLRHVLKVDIDRQIIEIGKEIEGLNKKIDEADDCLLSKQIDVETHNRILTRHKKCIEELEDKRSALKGNDVKEAQEKIKYSVNILENLGYYFQKADTEGKIKIIGSIFPEKLQFLENEYRTTRVNDVVAKINVIPSELQQLENKKATVSDGLSYLAPQVGLEPTTYGLTVRRSNQLSY